MGKTYEITLQVRGIDRASKPMGRVRDALGGIAKIAGGILAAKVISRIGSALANVGKEALSAAGRFQTLDLRFQGLIAREAVASGQFDTMREALMNMQGPADELLEWIKEVSVTTPFTVESIADATSLGLAMGFTTDKTKELALAVGDFTAGMGLSGEVMERVLYNFGQMVQQGKVTGTELRDLARGSFMPVNDILAQMQKDLGMTGMSFQDFADKARTGEVPVEAFFDAFITMANKDFPGAMDRMALTWAGVSGNIKDFIQSVLGFDILGPFVTRITTTMAEGLQKLMSPEMREGAKNLGISLDFAFSRIWGSIKENLLPALKELAEAFGISFEETPSLTQMTTDFVNAMKDGIEKISGFTSKLAELVETYGPKVKEFFQTVADYVKEHWPVIKEVILGIIAVVVPFVLAFKGAMAIVGIIGAIQGAVAVFGLFMSTAFGPVVLIIAAIAAVVGLLVVAWNRDWGGIQEKTKTAVAAIKKFFVELWEKIKLAGENIKQWFENTKSGFQDFIASVAAWVQGIGDKIRNFFEGYISFWMGIWQGIFDVVNNVFGWIRDNVITPFLNFINSTLLPVIQSAAALIASAWDLVKAAFELFWAVVSKIFEIFVALWLKVATTIADVAGQIISVLMDTLAPVFEALKIVWESLVTVAERVANAVGGFLTTCFENFKSTLNTVAGVIKGVAAIIKSQLISRFNALKAVINTVWGVVKGFAAILKSQLSARINAVKSIVLGLWRALKASLTPAFNTLKTIISGTVSSAFQKIKGKMDALKRTMDNVKSIIDKVKEAFRKLAAKVKNFKLPDWLTPGSPTPFELGLLGIEEALKKVDRQVASTNFAPDMAQQPAYAMAGGTSYSSRGPNNINFYISGSQDPDKVVDAIMWRLRQRGVLK